MNLLFNIIFFILQTVSYLYTVIILLRFLFQLVRADFYNPLSQAVIKLTNPLLIPFRKIIPGLYGFDLACIVLALLVQIAAHQTLWMLSGRGLLNPAALILGSFISLISIIVDIYFWGLLIMVIASWIAPQSYNPAMLLLRQLFEPVLMPLRRILPPQGGLDFSPLLAGMILFIAKDMLVPALTRTLMAPFA
ncbi:MAG: YggT family protein [Exilibacterium sp.]